MISEKGCYIYIYIYTYTYIAAGWVRGVALYFSVLAMSGANPKSRKVAVDSQGPSPKSRKVEKSKSRKVEK